MPDPAHAQAFPGCYPGSARPAHMGAAIADELGLPGLTDTRYHLTFRFDHTASDLDLTLRSLDLPEGARWGIDAVEIKIDAGWSTLYLPLLTK